MVSIYDVRDMWYAAWGLKYRIFWVVGSGICVVHGMRYAVGICNTGSGFSILGYEVSVWDLLYSACGRVWVCLPKYEYEARSAILSVLYVVCAR